MSTPMDFAPLVSGSHVARFRALLPDGFQTGEDPTGTEVKITGGGVDFDATAEVRATGSVTLAEPWPTPRDLSIAPYGSEIFLARGIDLGANGVLWASLGYFRINDDRQGDAARGPVTVSLDDRMMTIIESRFLQPRQWLIGTLVGDIVEEVVTEVYPDAVIVWDDDSNLSQLGRSIIVEESRYEILDTIATGLGKIFYWNTAGQLVFETIPDEQTPVWTVNAGPRGVMVNADRSLSRDNIYNAVVVTGEGADQQEPVRAVAFNNQESSPTRFGGPFGRIPRFYSSPFITTQLQAENAAVNLLQRSLGATYDVGLSAVPNPALRPYDPIRVVYDDGTREMHVVERVSVPLTNDGTMNIATRESVIVSIGVT